MRAAILNEIPGRLEIADVDVDSPGPREVLIRTVAAGLCHSDLHFMDGNYTTSVPAVLGHESAGVVEAVGRDVHYVSPGDHVITCLASFCGHCQDCLAGHPARCQRKSIDLVRPADQPSRLSRDGRSLHQFLYCSSFAEQLLVHENTVVRIPDEMPLDRAALIGCGVTTGLGAVFRTARVEPGSDVVVIGCGGIGLAAVQGARIAGANRIIAVDPTGGSRKLAVQLGATDSIDPTAVDPVSAVRELTDGGARFTFEAVGLKATAEQSFQMLRTGGQATVIGLIPLGTMVEVHGVELTNEKTLTGSNMGSTQFRVDMPRYVQMYLDGRLQLDQMLTHSIGLDDVNDGFDRMKSGLVGRQVIQF